MVGIIANVGSAAAQAKAPCKEMRKVKLGVSVSPPNVVHTPVYVARDLGIFTKHCIEAEIVEFEGGASAANLAAVTQGQALATINATAIAQGLKAKQFWGMAPRLPQAYMVSEEIKTAADLKGKRLSATGGGVGGLNWVMGREVLKTAGLKVDDAQFISAATAGRLPGLHRRSSQRRGAPSGRCLPRAERKARAARARGSFQADAEIFLQRLRRGGKHARQGPGHGARRGDLSHRGQSRHLQPERKSHSDHGGSDQKTSGGGQLRL